MRSILAQIIQLYPNKTVTVSMESGDTACGRPGELIPETNPGLFVLTDETGTPQEAVSICHIAAVRVADATYSNAITYLPTPTPAPEGCGADCEAAVRAYLPTCTKCVEIRSGNQTVGQGKVKKNKFGILVLVHPKNCNPTFVATNKAEILIK